MSLLPTLGMTEALVPEDGTILFSRVAHLVFLRISSHPPPISNTLSIMYGEHCEKKRKKM